MPKLITLFLSLIALSISTLFAYNPKDYEVPTDLKAIVDAHEDEILSYCSIQRFSWLPGYIVKQNAQERIKGLEICQQTLNRYPEKMSLIRVPEKRVYKEKFVIANRVYNNPEINLTVEQTQQIADFTMATGWFDLHRGNIACDDNGLIYIIDTEGSHFYFPKALAKTPTSVERITRIKNGIIGLIKLIPSLKNESKQYLHRRIKVEKAKIAPRIWDNEELKLVKCQAKNNISNYEWATS